MIKSEKLKPKFTFNDILYNRDQFKVDAIRYYSSEFKLGEIVIVRWTNAHSNFMSRAKVIRINDKSVRVELGGKEYYKNGIPQNFSEKGKLKAGHKITIKCWEQTANNCILPSE